MYVAILFCVNEGRRGELTWVRNLTRQFGSNDANVDLTSHRLPRGFRVVRLVGTRYVVRSLRQFLLPLIPGRAGQCPEVLPVPFRCVFARAHVGRVTVCVIAKVEFVWDRFLARRKEGRASVVLEVVLRMAGEGDRAFLHPRTNRCNGGLRGDRTCFVDLQGFGAFVRRRVLVSCTSLQSEKARRRVDRSNRRFVRVSGPIHAANLSALAGMIGTVSVREGFR